FLNFLPIDIQLALKYNDTFIDMRFVKQIYKIMLDKVSQTQEIILTLEENCISGGAGSAVNEYILAKDLRNKIIDRNFGLQD
ncbi:transketolase C-terminal domain-containing protein, partial [Francisella tularensis]|uniref:transketolase C-terminal domain-containing protein n=1 Tax=Francisella tularensis TaxID=263 RepID=UPI002381ADA2